MNIQVTMIKENEDGSAQVEIDLDDEGKMFLLQEGLIAVITKAIKKEENDSID